MGQAGGTVSCRTGVGSDFWHVQGFNSYRGVKRDSEAKKSNERNNEGAQNKRGLRQVAS